MASKNNMTQNLFAEMRAKSIKGPATEVISSLDSGRPPTMIFTSRGKVARNPFRNNFIDAENENGNLRWRPLSENVSQYPSNYVNEHGKHLNGNVNKSGDNSTGNLLINSASPLRRPAPSPPFSLTRTSLSSSSQSLNKTTSGDPDITAVSKPPPLIPAPKTFLERRSSLSSSTPSLSSPKLGSQKAFFAPFPPPPQPALTLPHSHEPDLSLTHSHEPDLSLPHPHEPDLSLPSPHEPDLLLPHSHEPDLSLPHPHEPDLSLPSPHEPDLSLPHSHEPDLSLPHPHEPDLSLLHPHEPDLSLQHSHLPDLSLPHPHEPDLSLPHPHEPDLSLPHSPQPALSLPPPPQPALSLPPPPPPDCDNEINIQASSSIDLDHQQFSLANSIKTRRAPEPPPNFSTSHLPSPPPVLSPPLSPLPPMPTSLSSPSSSSSSSASSSPLNRFRFPPPPNTPPPPIENCQITSSFTNTSLTSPGLLSPSKVEHTQRPMSPTEVMEYFDDAIGEQTFSTSSYNDALSYTEFSPAFHFPSVSDDKLLEPFPPVIGTPTGSEERKEIVKETKQSKVDPPHSKTEIIENTDLALRAEMSELSPKSEEDRKRRGHISPMNVAVSKLRPDVRTVRQHIKPGTVDELTSLFTNMKDEHITSPVNREEFDFDIRETKENLESLDKTFETTSLVPQTNKKTGLLSPSELFRKFKSSVSAGNINDGASSRHSLSYSKVNQSPRLYSASSASSVHTSSALNNAKATPGFDFLSASRKMYDHVVLIRSNSRSESSRNMNKTENVGNDSAVAANISNNHHEDSQEMSLELQEDKATTGGMALETTGLSIASISHSSRTNNNQPDSFNLNGESNKVDSDSIALENQHLFPITPTNSQNSSRRGSHDETIFSEDIPGFSNNMAVKGEVASSLTTPTNSRNSSRTNSQERKEDLEKTHSFHTALQDALVSTVASNVSGKSSRSSSAKSGSKGDKVYHETSKTAMSSSSASSASTPGGSRSSSRTGSLKRSSTAAREKNDYDASIMKNFLSSEVATNSSHVNSTSSSRTNSPERSSKVNGALIHSDNTLTMSINNVLAKEKVADSNNIPLVEIPNLTSSTSSSSRSSRSGSLSIKNESNEINTDNFAAAIESFSAQTNATSTTGHEGSISSSPEVKKIPQDTIDGSENISIKSSSSSSISTPTSSRRSSQDKRNMGNIEVEKENAHPNRLLLDGDVTNSSLAGSLDVYSKSEGKGSDHETFTLDHKMPSDNSTLKTYIASEDQSETFNDILRKEDTTFMEAGSPRSSSQTGSLKRNIITEDTTNMIVSDSRRSSSSSFKSHRSSRSSSRSSSLKHSSKPDDDGKDILDNTLPHAVTISTGHSGRSSSRSGSFKGNSKSDDMGEVDRAKSWNISSTRSSTSSRSSSREGTPKRIRKSDEDNTYSHSDAFVPPMTFEIPVIENHASDEATNESLISLKATNTSSCHSSPNISTRSSRSGSPERISSPYRIALEQAGNVAYQGTAGQSSSRGSSHASSLDGNTELDEIKDGSRVDLKTSIRSSNSGSSSSRSSSISKEDSMKRNSKPDEKNDYDDSAYTQDIVNSAGFDDAISTSGVNNILSNSMKIGSHSDKGNTESFTEALEPIIIPTIRDTSTRRSWDYLLNGKEVLEVFKAVSTASSDTTPRSSRKSSRAGSPVREKEPDEDEADPSSTTTHKADFSTLTATTTSSRDSSPDRSLKDIIHTDDHKTDSYQLALEKALESSVASSGRCSPVGAIRRISKSGDSSSSSQSQANSRRSSRSGSPRRNINLDDAIANYYNQTSVTATATTTMKDEVHTSSVTHSLQTGLNGRESSSSSRSTSPDDSKHSSRSGSPKRGTNLDDVINDYYSQTSVTATTMKDEAHTSSVTHNLQTGLTGRDNSSTFRSTSPDDSKHSSRSGSPKRSTHLDDVINDYYNQTSVTSTAKTMKDDAQNSTSKHYLKTGLTGRESSSSSRSTSPDNRKHNSRSGSPKRGTNLDDVINDYYSQPSITTTTGKDEVISVSGKYNLQTGPTERGSSSTFRSTSPDDSKHGSRSGSPKRGTNLDDVINDYYSQASVTATTMKDEAHTSSVTHNLQTGLTGRDNSSTFRSTSPDDSKHGSRSGSPKRGTNLDDVINDYYSQTSPKATTTGKDEVISVSGKYNLQTGPTERGSSSSSRSTSPDESKHGSRSGSLKMSKSLDDVIDDFYSQKRSESSTRTDEPLSSSPHISLTDFTKSDHKEKYSSPHINLTDITKSDNKSTDSSFPGSRTPHPDNTMPGSPTRTRSLDNMINDYYSQTTSTSALKADMPTSSYTIPSTTGFIMRDSKSSNSLSTFAAPDHDRSSELDPPKRSRSLLDMVNDYYGQTTSTVAESTEVPATNSIYGVPAGFNNRDSKSCDSSSSSLAASPANSRYGSGTATLQRNSSLDDMINNYYSHTSLTATTSTKSVEVPRAAVTHDSQEIYGSTYSTPIKLEPNYVDVSLPNNLALDTSNIHTNENAKNENAINVTSVASCDLDYSNQTTDTLPPEYVNVGEDLSLNIKDTKTHSKPSPDIGYGNNHLQVSTSEDSDSSLNLKAGSRLWAPSGDDAPTITSSLHELRGEEEVAENDPVDTPTTKQSKDFLSLLDNINIETDITSNFLRRSARFSGTYSPIRRHSHEIRTDLDAGNMGIDNVQVRDTSPDNRVTGASVADTVLALNNEHPVVEVHTGRIDRDVSATDFHVEDESVHDSESDNIHLAIDEVQFKEVSQEVHGTTSDSRHLAVEDLVTGNVKDEDQYLENKQPIHDYVNSIIHHSFGTVYAGRDNHLPDYSIDGEVSDSYGNDSFYKVNDELNTEAMEREEFIVPDSSIDRTIGTTDASDASFLSGRENSPKEDTNINVSAYVNSIIHHSFHQINPEEAEREHDVADVTADIESSHIYVNYNPHEIDAELSSEAIKRGDLEPGIGVDKTHSTTDMNDNFDQLVQEITSKESEGSSDSDIEECSDSTRHYLDSFTDQSFSTLMSTGDTRKDIYSSERERELNEHKVKDLISDYHYQPADEIKTEAVTEEDFSLNLRENQQSINAYINGIIHHSFGKINTEGVERNTQGPDLSADDEGSNVYTQEDFLQINAGLETGVIHEEEVPDLNVDNISITTDENHNNYQPVDDFYSEDIHFQPHLGIDASYREYTTANVTLEDKVYEPFAHLYMEESEKVEHQFGFSGEAECEVSTRSAKGENQELDIAVQEPTTELYLSDFTEHSFISAVDEPHLSADELTEEDSGVKDENIGLSVETESKEMFLMKDAAVNNLHPSFDLKNTESEYHFHNVAIENQSATTLSIPNLEDSYESFDKKHTEQNNREDQHLFDKILNTEVHYLDYSTLQDNSLQPVHSYSSTESEGQDLDLGLEVKAESTRCDSPAYNHHHDGEIFKVDLAHHSSETAMGDINEEIKKLHHVLSPKLSDDADKAHAEVTMSSYSNLSSAHPKQTMTEHRDTTKQTTFDSEFFNRSNSVSDHDTHSLSRLDSLDISKAENSPLGYVNTGIEFPRGSGSTTSSHSSCSSLSSMKEQQSNTTDGALFRTYTQTQTQEQGLPTTESMIVAAETPLSVPKPDEQWPHLGRSSDEESFSESDQENVNKKTTKEIDDYRVDISQSVFLVRDHEVDVPQEGVTDFKAVSHAHKGHITPGHLVQITPQKEDSVKQKEDESHLFSRDKFKALRNVFEKEQEIDFHETNNSKVQRKRFKSGSEYASPLRQFSASEELSASREFVDKSSTSGNDHSSTHVYLPASDKTETGSSLDKQRERSDSSRGSDSERGSDLPNHQLPKKRQLQKSLSYDFQTGELRRDSVTSATSIGSTSRSVHKDTEINVRLVRPEDWRESDYSNQAEERVHSKSGIFMQPGPKGFGHWSSEAILNKSGKDYTVRRSSLSSDVSSASPSDISKQFDFESHYFGDQVGTESFGHLKETAGAESLREREHQKSGQTGEDGSWVADLEKRARSVNSLDSGPSLDSSLEIEDHSLFEQADARLLSVTRYPDSTLVKTDLRQASIEMSDNSSVDSSRRSSFDVKSHSTVPPREYKMAFPVDDNFHIKPNITEHLTLERKNDLAKQPVSDNVRRERRKSSSGSEKEAEIIGAFLRSNVKSMTHEAGSYIVNRSDTPMQISHEQSHENSLGSYSLKAATNYDDRDDKFTKKRRESSSSESDKSSKLDFSRQTSSKHYENDLTETPGIKHRQDNNLAVNLEEIAPSGTRNMATSHDELFSSMVDNSSLHTSPRHSLATHRDQTRPDTRVTQHEIRHFKPVLEDEENQFNTFTSIDSNIRKGNEKLYQNLNVNDTIPTRNYSYPDEQTGPNIYVDSADRRGNKTISGTKDSGRLTQVNTSSYGAGLFNRSPAKTEPHSLTHDSGGYRDTLSSIYARDNARTRYVSVKSPGLDSSPIFPSLLNLSSKEVQQQKTGDFNIETVRSDHGHFSPRSYNESTRRSNTDLVSTYSLPTYNDVITHIDNSSTRRAPTSGRYTPSFDSSSVFFNNSVLPTSGNTSHRETFSSDSNKPLGSNTTPLYGSKDYSPASPTTTQPRLSADRRNQHHDVENRLHTTPIAISTTPQAVTGNNVGVHIDLSPNGSFHRPESYISSSDDESNKKLFIVKNVPRKSSLKTSSSHISQSYGLNDRSSDVREKTPTDFDAHRSVSVTGSLSPRLVVDGPTYRVIKSPRTPLSPSLSSDTSVTLPQHDHIIYSRQDIYEKPLSSTTHNEVGNLYRVRNLSSSSPGGLNDTENQRGRSQARSPNDSEKKFKSVPKRPHSPERFFKNPTLSLKKEDSGHTGYFSDEVDSKQYRTVTKVYLDGDQPRSRSQSAIARYNISSLQRQASFENSRSRYAENNDRFYEVLAVKSSDDPHESSPEFSDDSDSGFRGHQQKYRLVETSDSSLDKYRVDAQSSPKLGRKSEHFFEEATISRNESVPPTKTHRTVIQLGVEGNSIPDNKNPQNILDSRYMVKRVASADDRLKASKYVNTNNRGSDLEQLWKTGRSQSSERNLSSSHAAASKLEQKEDYDLPSRFVRTMTHEDNNKMYVVNSTVSDPMENHENFTIPPGWHKSTVDMNGYSEPQRIGEQRSDPHNYRTEKTVFLSRAMPAPSSTSRTKVFTSHDSGQNRETTNSNGEHEFRQRFERSDRIYEVKAEPRLPEQFHSMEDLSNDLRILRGKILIKNRMDDSEHSMDDFDQNVNLFDTSFHLGKDNPMYSSDPDIMASLQREEQEIAKHVHQDITFETVDRIAHGYKVERQVEVSPGPQRKKQNLSGLLLAKLANVDSKDIRQTVDVEHHSEEINGDIHFIHADGARMDSTNTYNFDSVNEKVELTLTQGKAYVIIKVIAERIVPTDFEFNIWRKSQAIVTRQIEIDLLANTQRKRLYEHVMARAGTSGSLEDGSYSMYHDTDSLSPHERQLSSMETLKLFSQILDVADEQGDSDHTGTHVRHEIGHPPGSAMDLMY